VYGIVLFIYYRRKIIPRKFLKRTKVYYFVPREPRSGKNGGSPPEGPCWKDPCGGYEKYFFRGSFKKVPKENKSVLFCSKGAEVRKKLGFTPRWSISGV